mmetsp:Transcript_6898/g.14879  ORF Transcript_6898/g.14879 Transcript_6898/m.14879 type:complete len:315 (-) Transcript_6898:350-1294(-)
MMREEQDPNLCNIPKKNSIRPSPFRDELQALPSPYRMAPRTENTMTIRNSRATEVIGADLLHRVPHFSKGTVRDLPHGVPRCRYSPPHPDLRGRGSRRHAPGARAPHHSNVHRTVPPVRRRPGHRPVALRRRSVLLRRRRRRRSCRRPLDHPLAPSLATGHLAPSPLHPDLVPAAEAQLPAVCHLLGGEGGLVFHKFDEAEATGDVVTSHHQAGLANRTEHSKELLQVLLRGVQRKCRHQQCAHSVWGRPVIAGRRLRLPGRLRRRGVRSLLGVGRLPEVRRLPRVRRLTGVGNLRRVRHLRNVRRGLGLGWRR